MSSLDGDITNKDLWDEMHTMREEYISLFNKLDERLRTRESELCERCDDKTDRFNKRVRFIEEWMIEVRWRILGFSILSVASVVMWTVHLLGFVPIVV
jgi:hypothetical protein